MSTIEDLMLEAILFPDDAMLSAKASDESIHADNRSAFMFGKEDETFTVGTETESPVESALDGEITADDEMDFTNDGIQEQRAVFQITKATRQRKNGGDILAVLQYTALDTEIIGFPITETYWLAHSNPQAERIGRSRIKPVFNALFGAPTGEFNALVGKYVSMWLKEAKKDGRATVGSPQSVSADAIAGSVDASL